MMDSSVKEFSMGLASIALWEEVITKAHGVMALKKELDYWRVLEIYTKVSGVTTQKWVMAHTLGKAGTLMKEDLFQIKGKEKDIINGEKDKSYLVGGKIINSMETSYTLYREKPMNWSFLTDK